MRTAPRLALAMLLALAACQVARPSALPRDRSVVALKSCRLPSGEAWISRFAQHGFIDAHRAGEAWWTRYEVLSASSGVVQRRIHPETAHEDLRWVDREVRVIETLEGDAADEVLERLPEVARELHERYSEGYHAWPGPNSNTFLVDVAREIPELGVAQHHNAVGKDHTWWIAAGLSGSRTGVHVDTLPLGFAIGLEEGIELHVLELTFGLSLFPPRVELPFLPELPWAADVARAPRPEADHPIEFFGTLGPGSTMGRTWTLEGDRASVLVSLEESDAWLFAELELATADGQVELVAHLLAHRHDGERRSEERVRLTSQESSLGEFDLGASIVSLFASLEPDGHVGLHAQVRSALPDDAPARKRERR